LAAITATFFNLEQPIEQIGILFSAEMSGILVVFGWLTRQFPGKAGTSVIW